MNAFLTSAIHTETPRLNIRIPAVSWIKARLEARQRRARDQDEIKRLRHLEPYLLADAGIDTTMLFAASARITTAHNLK